MKKFFSDFKKFISKGNIIDLAIAVVVGSAFSKIVTSLVNDVIMPLISLVTGGTSIQELKWVIKAAQYDANGVVVVAENALRYGAFLQAIIDFFIISFCIFVVFRIVNASTKKLEKLKEELISKVSAGKHGEPPTQQQVAQLTDAQRQEMLLIEIRDLLKANVQDKSTQGKNE